MATVLDERMMRLLRLERFRVGGWGGRLPRYWMAGDGRGERRLGEEGMDLG